MVRKCCLNTNAISVILYHEIVGTTIVTNAQMFISSHQTSELTLQNVFQSQSDHLLFSPQIYKNLHPNKCFNHQVTIFEDEHFVTETRVEVIILPRQ